uniref:Uncharacterized protein n=1 Tax=Candidatus Kentrum sp. LFY TaxID=2126342 RepID=A0A450WRE4_9GAMM|nr:MAG: hypothetical protein BECKLFY1418C_GA0070996_106019 [Candidatus Kentron sp. LFY]
MVPGREREYPTDLFPVFGKQVKVMPNIRRRPIIDVQSLIVGPLNLSIDTRNLDHHPTPHSAGGTGFFFPFAFQKRSPNWSATGFRPGGQSGRRS